MRDCLKAKADRMIEIYDGLRNKYKWKANDISLRFAAFIYCLSDSTFDLQKYDEMIKVIKRNTGAFSHYRATLLYPTAAQMLTRFNDPAEAFQDLLSWEEKMREEGFKKSSYLGIAAYALLLTCPVEKRQERIERAMDIYKRMKENHFWLTTSDDYAVAVLLAGEDKELGDMIQELEIAYAALHQEGFKRSNGLQFLSHLLSFGAESPGERIARCRDIFDFLKAHKLSVSAMYYGTVGYLALLGKQSTDALNEVVEMVEYFKASKRFKWYYKDINVMMISVLVGNEYMEEERRNLGLDAAAIGISVESLIAAQTAAMIAAQSAAASSAAAGAGAAT